ncbi:lysylphosphatidylglycerol synthase transmembrane domain-containing protein [Bacteroides sp.]|uniref:lysylphosphatidylglycerol synthase transmembrane domain-containing protein n=1 Tax=Bacteroides sp. TaxID=29523 RepID=UPI002590AEC1|nr:lysylphosphatidylglycerol synthase transmembrane domain-containing protein [Bacteroides sp.]
METKKGLKYTMQVLIAFGLGVGIIYWIYQDLDFDKVWNVLENETNWYWMILSLFFGVLSHVLRGWRWMLALEPLGVKPKRSNAVNAIFTSYAVNLVVPRLGEFTRCGVLTKYDQVSFSKSLGSVVAERFVDSACAFFVLFLAILLQGNHFFAFFKNTGIQIPAEGLLSNSSFYIFIFCFIAVIILLYWLTKKLTLLDRAKGILQNIWEGVIALRKIKKANLYWLFTALIWVCYFLHFYLTFYCFSFTSDLGPLAGLALFIVGSFAVVVPTPNGAGPWHFAVITMMMLYGVDKIDAGIFALIVHTIQSFLVVLLGTYGFVALPLSNKNY